MSKPDGPDLASPTKGLGITLEIQPSGHVIIGKKGITLTCITDSNENITWLHNGVPALPCSRCVLYSNSSLHVYKVDIGVTIICGYTTVKL